MYKKKVEKDLRRPVTLAVAGAGRGGTATVPELANLNRESKGLALALRTIDPVPGKADALAVIAKERGLPAIAIEGRIEDEIEKLGEKSPVLLHLDNAFGINSALEKATETDRTVVGFLLVRFSNDELMGLGFLLSPTDRKSWEEAKLLFARLALVTARRGSEAVLGAGGRREHVLQEAAFRKWFAEFLKAGLVKITAGLPPDSYPIVSTVDGKTTRPVIVREVEELSQPVALAESLSRDLPLPLLRGDEFVLAEVAPSSLRLTTFGRRYTDGALAVAGGAIVVDRPADADLSLDPSPAVEVWKQEVRREELRRAAEEAAARARRREISFSNPVVTTD